MDNVKDMYETMLRVSKKEDKLYEAYEKQVVENVEFKTFLQEEKEDKHQVHLQWQATTKALKELKCYDESIQADHEALKELLQEEKEEKQRPRYAGLWYIEEGCLKEIQGK